jgi:hypothetical protein
MKVFVLVWSPLVINKVIDRQELIDVLDKIPEIANWRASTGAIFLNSDADAITLYERIHSAMPNLLFVVSEININTCKGWDVPQTWDFIARPRSVGLP